jgi:hypothetical protein
VTHIRELLSTKEYVEVGKAAEMKRREKPRPNYITIRNKLLKEYGNEK